MWEESVITVKDLIDKNVFNVINTGEDTTKEISTPYCCDLLSIAMSKAPVNCAWVTIMGNINTLAVATLTDAACVILADGVVLDEAATAKLKTQNVTILGTELPIFEAALKIHQFIND